MGVRQIGSRTTNEVVQKWYPEPLEGDDVVDALMAMRKEEIDLREEMMAYQKDAQLEKRFDLAKYFSTEAKESLKRYRAICLLLGWYAANPPGDCPCVEPYEWHPDLFQALDTVNATLATNLHPLAA